MASREVGFASEFCSFVQSRLALVTAFLGLSGALFLVVSRVADLTNHGWVPGNWLHPSVVTHAVGSLLAVPIYLVLRGRTLSATALKWTDVAIAEATIAACLIMYAFSYETGIRQIVPILGLLLIARAVVIPSRARRTFLLSLPALVGVLAIQLAHGKVYTLDGSVWPQQGFVAYVLWDQAVLLIAIALATAASYVLYELRVRAYEAAQVGRYTLEHRIGGGAVGEVYRARHAHIRRPVAVKILRPEIAGERNLDLFEKEVQRTSELTHPNTVSIFDFGLTAEGLFYYAMEFLDGADLERVVRAGGPMSAPRAVHVLRQACGALSEAHARGLIHCDVKLENLMLCRRGGRPDVLKVLDFGLARNVARSGSGEGDGKAYGTPLTMAPEVIRGQEIGPTTDLYSLGAVAYYLVTGVPPYRGDTIGEVLVQHLRADPEPPSRLRPEVPSDLEDVILHCLAKERMARPSSAAELESALDGCATVGAWSLADAEAWWEAHAEKVRESADPQALGGGHRSLATVGVTTIG